jgi:maltose O-acetyltransferase
VIIVKDKMGGAVMNDEKRRQEGRLYSSAKLHDQKWIEAKMALDAVNQRSFGNRGGGNPLKDVFAELGEGSSVIPPLYYSQGAHIHIGDHVFVNAWLMVLDEADVVIGDHAYIGPNVSIYTPIHPLVPSVRNTGLQYAKPVHIGANVWIGGSVTILPGVTIGEGAVIGAGSVVTKDIPAGVVAVGNPCRVIRKITEEDQAYWEAEYQAYLDEENQAKE